MNRRFWLIGADRALCDVDDPVARQIWRAAALDVRRDPAVRREALALLALLFAAVGIAGWLLPWTVLYALRPLRLLLVVAGLALFALWWFIRQRPRYQRAIRRQLRLRGGPICLHCGYNLTGAAAPRCPECGAATR